VTKGLPINEIFGPVWQGEGRQTGQRCFFVRTATCNLECKWCDTPQTWVYSERKAEKHSRINVPFDIKTESARMNVGEIVDTLDALGARAGDLIVISGGEPLLQQAGLAELLDRLAWYNYRVAIETAGTIVPSDYMQSWANINWNVSVKLESSGNEEDKRIVPQAIRAFVQMGVDFKFVVQTQKDAAEVEDLVREFDIPRDTVWIMPEGIDAVTILDRARKLERWVREQRFNLTLRQHVLLFGDERGR
jgi:7-carboxy-7-deazaguanine synthase